MNDLPGPETGLRAGIRFPPSMQNTVSMRRRMHGRQPSERIFSHRLGLLSPRPVATARIVGGMALDKRLVARARVMSTCRVCRRAWRPARPGWRVPDRPRSRRWRRACRRALSDLWRARGRWDVHSDKTHRISGAKRARTSVRFGDGSERSAPSQSPVNPAALGWEAHGESPAALRFFLCVKDAGKPCAFAIFSSRPILPPPAPVPLQYPHIQNRRAGAHGFFVSLYGRAGSV